MSQIRISFAKQSQQFPRSLQRDHDACRPRCDCGLPPDLFSQLSVLFDCCTHQRHCRVVLVELAVFEFLGDGVGWAEVDRAEDDLTHSNKRSHRLSGFAKFTYSVKSTYLRSTSFQNSAAVLPLMCSKVLIERRTLASLSALKLSSTFFSGIPVRKE